MTRIPRKKSSTGVYHVMLRGINKQVIFEEIVDRIRFLKTLKNFKGVSNFKVYGYCLMDNHVHLLIQESEEGISNIIKRISSSYVYWYNTKYERCGHLFQERFKSENVETTRYFLTVLRYIHQNPVKAGLGKDVFESKWTSIHEYVGKADIIDVDMGLKLFSSERESAIKLFRDYMSKSNDDKCLDNDFDVRVSDNQVIEHLHKMGFASNSLLQQMEKKERDAALADLKKLKGVSVRQISRVTGISKSVIDRAR
ncbi:transposase [Fredinandcohnia humi]